jgi:hypothetical protein
MLGADVNLNMIVDQESSIKLGVTFFAAISLALIVALFVYAKFFR